MTLQHGKIPLPHERRGYPEEEPTHRDLMEKLEAIEEILRKLEEGR